MRASSLNDDEFQQREQALKEREMQVRLRELEIELEAQRTIANEQGENSSTVKHELDREALARQRKLRKMILFGKLALIAIGVATTVAVLHVLIFPILIFGVLGLVLYGIYIFFIQEKPEKKSQAD